MVNTEDILNCHATLLIRNSK